LRAWKRAVQRRTRAHFGTDLAVSHGFRYGTAIPPGDITLGELYTFFPMTTPVARGVAYGQQLTNHMEEFLGDNFTPYPYDQEDGRVRNFSSNVEVTLDPTAKRGRRPSNCESTASRSTRGDVLGGDVPPTR